MPTTATNTYSFAGIRPMYEPAEQCEIAVNLPASVSYTAGTFLGELSGTPGTAAAVSKAVVAAPSAALTPTAASGTTAFLAGDYTVAYTYVATGGGESTISPVVAVTLTAGQQINLALVTPLPTGAASVNYYVSTVPGGTSLVRATTALHTGAATAITGFAAGGAVPPATNGAYTTADGSQTAKYLLPWDCATDSSGNITLGSTTAGSSPYGATYKSVSVYHRGTFKSSECKQAGAGAISAAVLTDLGGHLINGTLADGVFRIP